MRIYVGGKYTDDHAFKVLNNMRIGMEYSVKVLKMGHSPYCPWLDYPFVWLEGGELEVERLYELSMDWLRVSDAVLLIPGWETSKGSVAEKEEAERLGIPIYYSLEDIPEVNK
jgi:hypothetical protein